MLSSDELRILDSWKISCAFLWEKIGCKERKKDHSFYDAPFFFFLWHSLSRGHWLAPVWDACGSTLPTHHAFGPVSRTCIYACLCGYLWPQLEKVQPAEGASCMTLCSWVPASGLILLEECVMHTEILWGLKMGGHSGPRGCGAGVRRAGRRLCRDIFALWRHLHVECPRAQSLVPLPYFLVTSSRLK